MAGALNCIRPSAAPVTPVSGDVGSPNAGILATVLFTLSGTTVTIVAQKNVASVTRTSAGNFRLTFTSALANSNYGVIANGRFPDLSGDNPAVVAPNRNTTGGFNTYSTTTVDIQVTGFATTTPFDPLLICVVIFDPSAVGSDFLAAAHYTLSGTTVTLQRQANVASVTRNATGVYRATWTSALADANYSAFGGARYADFSNNAIPTWGGNRNTTIPTDLHTTAAHDMAAGLLSSGGFFDIGRGSLLARNADAVTRGTVAAVRFSAVGGVITILKQFNVASITRWSAGLYLLNFTAPIIDANYGAFCAGKYAGSASDDTPIISANRAAPNGRGAYSTTQLDIAARSASGGSFDPDTVDVWVVRPGIM